MWMLEGQTCSSPAGAEEVCVPGPCTTICPPLHSPPVGGAVALSLAVVLQVDQAGKPTCVHLSAHWEKKNRMLLFFLFSSFLSPLSLQHQHNLSCKFLPSKLIFIAYSHWWLDFKGMFHYFKWAFVTFLCYDAWLTFETFSWFPRRHFPWSISNQGQRCSQRGWSEIFRGSEQSNPWSFLSGLTNSRVFCHLMKK